MDVLSSCVFGIKLDSIDNPDHPVVQNAKQFLALSPNLSRVLSVLTPRLAQFLRLEFFDPKTVQYFADLTKQIISERRKHKNGVNCK